MRNARWTSNDQERERDITILAECTSVLWHGLGETRINIIDPPGHADASAARSSASWAWCDGCARAVGRRRGRRVSCRRAKFVLGKALKVGLR